VGYPVAGGASALATTRLWFGVLTRGQQAVEFSGAVRGFFRAKAQCLGANDGNVCGCHNPLWGVVVVILAMLRLRVKTLDLLRALLWSPDPTRSHFVAFSGKFGFPYFLCFIFDLLCKRFSSPSCIGSAVVALFIKRDKNLFQGK
jgi:hypothetical protein